MEILQFATILWRWAWLVVLGGLLGGAAAFAITRQIEPVYEASTTFAVTIRSQDLNSDDQTVVLETYAQLLKKRPILEQVIHNLSLDLSPGDLAEQIEVELAGNETLLVEVMVQDSDPVRAASIANELITVLVEQGRVLLGSDRIVSRAIPRIIEAAQPPQRPISPRSSRNLILGLVIGTLLAAGGAIVKESLDTTIRSGEHVAQITGLDTLAAVPRTSRLFARADLITLSEPASPAAEVYRLLRARIEHATADQSLRTVTVTGCHLFEGKSTVAANLAVVLAQAGKRVVLVDTDLRRPTLHTLFQQKNEYGLTSALIRYDSNWISDHLLPTPIDNLRLMPAGPLPANPAELLSSPRMAELCDQLRAYADIVLFDSPPVLASVDPLLLARITDAALFVVRANATRAEELLQATSQLEKFGVHALGVVLNFVPEGMSSFRKAYHRKPERATPIPLPQALSLAKRNARDRQHLPKEGLPTASAHDQPEMKRS